jgi:hypothetical protein
MSGHSCREHAVTRIRSGWITGLAAAALAACPLAGHAQNDAMLATVDRAATVTVQRAPVSAAPGPQRRARVIVSFTNYSPSADCAPVEVVVKGRAGGGPELEVGRFAVTPNGPFNGPEPQSVGLPLPSQLVTDVPVHFSIQLVPVEGGQPNPAVCATGGPPGDRRAGASLRISAVEIR